MKNIIIICFFCLLLFSTSGIYAQSNRQITISGIVKEESTNKALEYATISVSTLSGKIVEGGLSEKQGRFSIKIPQGTYNISVDFIGFKPIVLKAKKLLHSTNLGTIILKADVALLDEVEVVAEKTTIELKLDKKIYNVGKDLTVRGGTMSDVLDNVPSVSVDIEGNVSLRGNENVRILINGKPSSLVGISSTEALQQFPAEAVEKVEVVTSPSARYDAEGTAGILNIILHKNKLHGLNGAIHTHVGYPKEGGVSGNLNYRTGDFNFFITTNYRYANRPGYSLTKTQYFNKQTNPQTQQVVDMPDSFLDEYRDFQRVYKSFSSNLGVEWQLDKSTSIIVSGLHKTRNVTPKRDNTIKQFDENRKLLTTSNRTEEEDKDDKSMEYAFNLTKNFGSTNHKLTIDAQYEGDKETEDGNIKRDNLNIEKTERRENQKRYLLQTDYTLPIGKHQIELGYKGSFEDNNTDYTLATWDENKQMFKIDEGVSNFLNYKENIHAGYIQLGSKIGTSLSYLLGLRIENTSVKIAQKTKEQFREKSYTRLFPTINLNYELSPTQSITWGYARRIRRARSFMMNPFPSRSSLTTIFQGNPDIDPSLSNTFDLGILNRFNNLTISSSIYYQHTTDVFNLVSFDTGTTVTVKEKEVPVIRMTPINLSENNRWGFETTLNYTPSKTWRISGNINVFKSITKGSYNTTSFDAKNFSWFARLINKYTLPGKIDWQTRMMYRGPNKDAQNEREGVLSINMAFNKDLFHERASLTFNISDLTNSRKRIIDTTTPTYFAHSEFQWHSRNFRLSFTYRFNQKKKRNGQMKPDVDEEGIL